MHIGDCPLHFTNHIPPCKSPRNFPGAWCMGLGVWVNRPTVDVDVNVNRQTLSAKPKPQIPTPTLTTHNHRGTNPLRSVAEVALYGHVVMCVCVIYGIWIWAWAPLRSALSVSANKRRAQKKHSCCYSTQQQQNQWVIGRVLRPATAMITHWNILCFPHPCRGRCFATIAIV